MRMPSLYHYRANGGDHHGKKKQDVWLTLRSDTVSHSHKQQLTSPLRQMTAVVCYQATLEGFFVWAYLTCVFFFLPNFPPLSQEMDTGTTATPLACWSLQAA